MLGRRKTVELLFKQARKSGLLEKLAQVNTVTNASFAVPRPYDSQISDNSRKTLETIGFDLGQYSGIKNPPPVPRPRPERREASIGPANPNSRKYVPEVHAPIDWVIGHETANRLRRTRLGAGLGGVASGVNRALGDAAYVGGALTAGIARSVGASGPYDRFADYAKTTLNNRADRYREAVAANQARSGVVRGRRNTDLMSAFEAGNATGRAATDMYLGSRAWPVLSRFATSPKAVWAAPRLANAVGTGLFGIDQIAEGNPAGGAALLALGALGANGPAVAGGAKTVAGRAVNAAQQAANKVSNPVVSAFSRTLPSSIRPIGVSSLPVTTALVPGPHQLSGMVRGAMRPGTAVMRRGMSSGEVPPVL